VSLPKRWELPDPGYRIWLVKDAVSCEPLSRKSTLISLFYREFTGKITFFGASNWKWTIQNPQNSAVSAA
jgi:hypothetical protein